MKIKAVVASGLVGGMCAYVVGSLLYMNPVVAGIWDANRAWPGFKPMEAVGGIWPFMLMMLGAGLATSVLLAYVYAFAERGMDMAPWEKGLLFGFLMWLVTTVPHSFYTWLMYTYPPMLITMETLNGLASSLVGGLVIALFYDWLG